MAIRVAWDRTPVSVHGTKDELESLIRHLRENHGFRKHSIIMLTEKMRKKRLFSSMLRDPRWISEFVMGDRMEVPLQKSNYDLDIVLVG